MTHAVAVVLKGRVGFLAVFNVGVVATIDKLAGHVGTGAVVGAETGLLVHVGVTGASRDGVSTSVLQVLESLQQPQGHLIVSAWHVGGIVHGLATADKTNRRKGRNTILFGRSATIFGRGNIDAHKLNTLTGEASRSKAGKSIVKVAAMLTGARCKILHGRFFRV